MEGASAETKNGEAGFGPGRLISLLSHAGSLLSCDSLLEKRQAPSCPPALLASCPPLAHIQPTNLECHRSKRFLPGRCVDLSRVSRAELCENPGGRSWSQSPRLLDRESRCSSPVGARKSSREHWPCCHAGVHSPFSGLSHRDLRITSKATLQAGTPQEMGLVTHAACLVGRECPPGRLQPKFQMKEVAGGPHSGWWASPARSQSWRQTGPIAWWRCGPHKVRSLVLGSRDSKLPVILLQ